MPRSSKRHQHHKSHVPTHLPHTKKKSSSVPVFVIFLGILGAGIALFAAASNVTWILAGAAIGAVAGYLIGKTVDRQSPGK